MRGEFNDNNSPHISNREVRKEPQSLYDVIMSHACEIESEKCERERESHSVAAESSNPKRSSINMTSQFHSLSLSFPSSHSIHNYSLYKLQPL
jgi:hypothetical protein